MVAASQLVPGTAVWVPTSDDKCFEKGTVEKVDSYKGSVVVKTRSGSTEQKEAQVSLSNAESQDGVPDNTLLRELNEASLLHNVKSRYCGRDDGGIYSYTGHILIAVNPFRRLNIYEDSTVRPELCGETNHYYICRLCYIIDFDDCPS